MKTPSLSHAVRFGAFVVVLYLACLLWRYTMTEPAVVAYHLTALKTAFPGFKGYDPTSILWGSVLSFIYGFVAAWVFQYFHCGCACKK